LIFPPKKDVMLLDFLENVSNGAALCYKRTYFGEVFRNVSDAYYMWENRYFLWKKAKILNCDRILYDWMRFGRLNSAVDFFIQLDSKFVTSKGYLLIFLLLCSTYVSDRLFWTRGFKFLEEKVPKFLKHCAKDVLFSGTVACLANRLGITVWFEMCSDFLRFTYSEQYWWMFKFFRWWWQKILSENFWWSFQRWKWSCFNRKLFRPYSKVYIT